MAMFAMPARREQHDNIRKYVHMISVRKLISFLTPYRKWTILAPTLMLLEVAMDLAQPWMMKRIIDEGIGGMNLAFVIQAGALMIVLALIGAAGGIGCSIFAVKAAQGIGADLRAAIFRKIQAFSFGNLDQLGSGALITRLTSDVIQVQEAVLSLLRIMVRAPLMMIGSFAMAILIAPRLAWMPFGLMLLVLLGATLIIRKAYPLYGLVQTELDGLNTAMQENLAGIRVVKAFARAAREISRFKHINARLTDKSIRVARMTVSAMPMMMILVNIGVVAALWFGGIQVNRGNMHVGQIVAFINYLQRALMSLMMIGMMVMQLSKAAASAKRIQQSLSIEPDVKNKPRARPTDYARGRIVFEKVSFSYDGHSGKALHNVSFTAEAGQTVALLGSTGSGKSTLAHLIPRFYDATFGYVTFDGIDVRDLDQAFLRRNVGIVLQETILFSGSIRDNIRYGRSDAGDDAVIAAAEIAQAHAFIRNLPRGYDTALGRRGVNLSGGQKQRIAIARALLARPVVLILDDCASAVDIETEAEIMAAIEKEMRGCTRFIIAQRIGAVMHADKIIVLDEGRIAAEGPHGELMNSSPVYRDFFESQFGSGRQE